MKKIVIIPFFLLMGCTDSNTVSNNVKENAEIWTIPSNIGRVEENIWKI